jgi:alpha-beta hydrolase superfamily lysophospholipase
MAEHIGRYEAFAETMVKKGFVVTGHDYLGHGKTIKEKSERGYFCEKNPATVVVEDVHTLHKLTREEHPNVPYVLLGHSMGSFIVRNYMGRYGQELSAVILLGTAMLGNGLICFGKTVNGMQKALFSSKHVSKFLNYLSFGCNINRFKPARTPVDWLTRDEQIIDAYIADPLCGFLLTANGFDGLFEWIGCMNRPEVMQNIPKELPVLIMSGMEDPVGDFGKGPGKACELMQKVGLTNVALKLYEGARHELLNETNREEVIKDICEWLGKNLSVL